MIVYAETSAVLRWLLAAPGGDEVRAVLETAEAVATARLTIIESERGLIRAVSRGDITDARSMQSTGILAAAAAHWNVAELLPEIAERAGRPFPVEPVRTLDAIHLATALLFASSGPVAVLSTDERVRRNAVALGLGTLPG